MFHKFTFSQPLKTFTLKGEANHDNTHQIQPLMPLQGNSKHTSFSVCSARTLTAHVLLLYTIPKRVEENLITIIEVISKMFQRAQISALSKLKRLGKTPLMNKERVFLKTADIAPCRVAFAFLLASNCFHRPGVSSTLSEIQLVPSVALRTSAKRATVRSN